MPELPEVETVRRGLSRHLQGHSIISAAVRLSRLRYPIPAALPELVAGRPIVSIDRRAKYLLMDLAGGVLLIHLGMSGSLRIVSAAAPIGRHDHIDFQLSDERLLRFADPRRFGAVLWLTGDPSEHPLLKRLGPEPLGSKFDGNYLYRRSRGRKLPIKQFLMDSQIVAGIGNIYANEILYVAGVHPLRPAGQLSAKRYQRLAEAVGNVLNRAIEKGGTTLKDFVNDAGRPGYFQIELFVYGRSSQMCRKCARPLVSIRQAQRQTVYCRSCQR